MFILESSACTDPSVLATILFIKKLIRILCVIAPAVLIVLLTIDIAKSVAAGDDNELKRAQKLSAKRIIYALIIFFIPILVNGVFGLLSSVKVAGSTCYTNATDEKIETLMNEQKDKEKAKQEEKEKDIEKTKEEQARQKENKKKAREEAAKKEKEKQKANNDNVKSTNTSYKSKTKLSKTYKDIKILDTLKKSDFSKKQTVKTGSSTPIAQSFAVVNDYYVVMFVSPTNTQSSVGVFNKSTAKSVNSFSGFSFGHSNGASYIVNKGEVYVTHGLLTRTKVHRFSTSKIGSRKSINTESFSLSQSVSGIGYDRVTGKLYYASGDGIYKYSNGKLKQVVHRKSFIFGMSQDICVHNDIIYDIRINGGSTIDIYTTSGSYLGSYKVDVGYELESIDYYGEGQKMALLFHKRGQKHYIYVINTIMPQ